MSVQQQDVVVFNELAAANGKKIGVATLNAEKSLNALSLPMARLLLPQLAAWQDNPDIACVWLQGAGEKAFCAGGDIVAMYHAMREQPGQLVAEVEQFFTEEYRLDHAIHSFNKPFIVWADGIVMGGGMGLMNGASHRIVTERSLLAMPEISIGLYPDVGATYFLNRMPAGCGLFLGLTGAHMNATDAQFLRLADHFIGREHKTQVLTALQQLEWGDTTALNKQKVSDLLGRLSQQDTTQPPPAQVEPLQPHLRQLTDASDISSVVEQIVNDDKDSDWLARARKTLAAGCPLTAHIVWQQLQHGADLSLADCFRLELTLSVNCCIKGDFAEGIRALLIDKDKQPQWQYSRVAEVDGDAVDALFTSPWDAQQHPLRDLG